MKPRRRLTPAPAQPVAQPAVPALPVYTRTGAAAWSPVLADPAEVATSAFPSAALGFYIFLLSSLAHEFLTSYAGIQLPIVAGCFAILVLIYFVAGRPGRFFATPFAIPWIALMVWWVIAGFLGHYPRRSLDYLWPFALRIHTLPIVFAGIIQNFRGLCRALFGAGFGLMLLLVWCIKFGTMSDDRFIIPNTELGNANDLALRLLMYGSLFLIFFGTGKFRRVLGILTIPVLMYYVLRTGSRANLITMAICMAVAIYLMPPKRKILAIFLAVAVPLVAFPFVPAETQHRLFSFFGVASYDVDTQHDLRLEQNAVDSTNARLELQKRAIQLTLEHPVFGVGPLNFEDAVEDMVRAKEQKKSGWQVSHNTYLQVSSEAGIPGLIFYCWSVGLCLVLNYRNYRRSHGTHALVSFSLMLASLTYAVGVLFCSIAYDYALALLVGLTAADYLILRPRNVVPNIPAVLTTPARPGAGAVKPAPAAAVSSRGSLHAS